MCWGKKILPDLNAIAYFSNTMHFHIYALIILIRHQEKNIITPLETQHRAFSVTYTAVQTYVVGG